MRRHSIIVLMIAQLAGCSPEPPPRGDGRAEPKVAKQRGALQAQEPLSDEPSPPAIVLHWADAGAVQRDKQALEIAIENTTDSAIRVALDVFAVDPAARVDGEPDSERSAPVGSRVVPPRATLSEAIPIERVPIQTVGGDCQVMVRARYTISAQDPFSRQERQFPYMAATARRHVTFVNGFRTATLRTYEAQRDHADAFRAARARARLCACQREADLTERFTSHREVGARRDDGRG